ncbi:hypothetical protein GGS23DRAFT_577602 [Durotheca rogersii]|uniref:uncharacterized protein n=1 Tax=Durotheca rogersii TaxID=419775 RepID=UPI00221EB059|nr:uncharacterized protein GGS23DRAFT_577602 [Durotheca rogersii]KAI5861218.1 hypothetical protein GGS23DRAFT_577602 [Durotheca rogersii]
MFPRSGNRKRPAQKRKKTVLYLFHLWFLSLSLSLSLSLCAPDTCSPTSPSPSLSHSHYRSISQGPTLPPTPTPRTDRPLPAFAEGGPASLSNMERNTAAPDVDISNGTCYFNINNKANGLYIPCGNVAVGVDWACCLIGDLCMSSNACYHQNFEITYVAGCTDSTFRSPQCPHKGQFANQPWVGLQRCDPLTDTWGGCEEDGKGDWPGRGPPAACKCDGDTQLFVDKPKLDYIASLPTSQGGFISWGDLGRPTIAPTNIASTASDSTLTGPSTTSAPPFTTTISSVDLNATAGATPAQLSAVPSSDATATQAPALPIAAQAGIGAGAGVGALLIGGVAVMLLLRKRKAARADCARAETPSDLPEGTYIEPKLYDGNNGPGSPAFSGFKSELPADEPLQHGSAQPTPLSSSFPPSPSHAQAPIPPQSMPASPQETHSRQYHAYNPLLHGDYAAMKSYDDGNQQRRHYQQSEPSLRVDEAAQPPVSPLSPRSETHGSLSRRVSDAPPAAAAGPSSSSAAGGTAFELEG